MIGSLFLIVRRLLIEIHHKIHRKTSIDGTAASVIPFLPVRSEDAAIWWSAWRRLPVWPNTINLCKE